MSTQTTTEASLTTKQSSFKLTIPYGDWRDILETQGYVVIKVAVDPQTARYCQQKAFDWLKSFDPALDLNDSSTSKLEIFPSGQS